MMGLPLVIRVGLFLCLKTDFTQHLHPTYISLMFEL